MDSEPADTAISPPTKDPSTSPSAKKDHEEQNSPHAVSGQENSSHVTSPTQSSPGISLWARNLKIPLSGSHDESAGENSGKSTFARFTNNLAMRLSPKPSLPDESSNDAAAQSNLIESFAKGLVDSSRNAVKAVQVKARHVVSQNKRRYQGLYRNYMEEVIKFFESHHKVASFPFDDHNCPPMQLIISFCQSAYAWLKQDIENVVVVHCKAGMVRTGPIISSLLLFLKFFPTAEESIDYHNQKRCFDGKGLVLPSQIVHA